MTCSPQPSPKQQGLKSRMIELTHRNTMATTTLSLIMGPLISIYWLLMVMQWQSPALLTHCKYNYAVIAIIAIKVAKMYYKDSNFRNQLAPSSGKV
jgi:hypothetical protein